jgi:hypothetical protein
MASIKWPTSGTILLIGAKESTLQRANEHARSLLCENGTRSCALFDANSHPDFRFIAQEEGSQWIKIDQIRELMLWANGKPQISNIQVAILAPAHTLNLQAADALLKTLEEPSLSTLFILVTDKPSFLPATIRSRCYWIRLKTSEMPAPFSELKNKIKQDLDALRSHQIDPISVGAEWVKQDPKQVLHWITVIMNEELSTAVLNNHPLKKSQFKNDDTWKFLDIVINAKRSLEESNQPNTQLLLESILIEYARE